MAEHESGKKAAAKVTAGVGLAVVITQILDASGIHMGENFAAPLGAVLTSIIHKAGDYMGGNK